MEYSAWIQSRHTYDRSQFFLFLRLYLFTFAWISILKDVPQIQSSVFSSVYPCSDNSCPGCKNSKVRKMPAQILQSYSSVIPWPDNSLHFFPGCGKRSGRKARMATSELDLSERRWKFISRPGVEKEILGIYHTDIMHFHLRPHVYSHMSARAEKPAPLFRYSLIATLAPFWSMTWT